MILERITTLTQEPWCFHADQIGRLTDWQILNLYYKPAIARQEAQERQRKGQPEAVPAGTPTERPPMGSPEMRAWVIAQFMKWGLTQKQAEKKFDEQSKQG